MAKLHGRFELQSPASQFQLCHRQAGLVAPCCPRPQDMTLGKVVYPLLAAEPATVVGQCNQFSLKFYLLPSFALPQESSWGHD
jgi:hypothetical protein